MSAVSHSGPTAVSERALAPDLARGVMLLFIALANTHFFLPPGVIQDGPGSFGGFPGDLGPVDRVVAWAISSFVDERAYPLFGLLFGYGVARIVARNAPTHTIMQVRRLLWRRSGVLIVVGAIHGLVLFVGDVLAAYGVLLLVGAWAIGWKDRTLWLVAAFFFVICALPDPDAYYVSTTYDPAMVSGSPAVQVRERLETTPWIALLAPVGFACPFLIGLWAGRWQLLERPAEHRRLLAITAVVGIAVGVLGAQPVALGVAQLRDWPSEDAMAWLGPLHTVTGYFGGFGYAALLALVALRIGSQPGRVVRALAATGQRSMTCYLAQSVVWFVVFTPYLLGLYRDLSVTATAGLAVLTWLATVVLADRMRAAGERGPFERLTRRVTYGAQPAGGNAPQPTYGA